MTGRTMSGGGTEAGMGMEGEMLKPGLLHGFDEFTATPAQDALAITEEICRVCSTVQRCYGVAQGGVHFVAHDHDGSRCAGSHAPARRAG